ncbi:MAG TPA: DsbA family protein [Casimicrobiaceae bacterium]|jgi:protein-disulfide isomerase|nr:DsbA family protein [Casimicrobiaceae bacterium]
MKIIRQLTAATIAAAALAFAVPPANADMTQEQVQELLTELKGIRAALEKMSAPAPAAQPQEPVSDKVAMALPANAYSLGKADAPVVMIEYTDLQCPFCQQFHNTAYEQIKKNYIDTGKVLFLSRDFPLDFHPWARPAAIAARCAGDQGKFWELRNVLIANADKLSKEMISQHASDLKLDMKKFQSCADSDFYTADINKQVAEGTAAGVNGTPSFVIGKMENGQLDGVRLVGAMPYATFEAKINELLAAPAK